MCKSGVYNVNDSHEYVRFQSNPKGEQYSQFIIIIGH